MASSTAHVPGPHAKFPLELIDLAASYRQLVVPHRYPVFFRLRWWPQPHWHPVQSHQGKHRRLTHGHLRDHLRGDSLFAAKWSIEPGALVQHFVIDIDRYDDDDPDTSSVFRRARLVA